MKIKLILALGVCCVGLVTATSVFAAMTPEQKNTALENQYQQNKGANAQAAKSKYDSKSSGQQQNIKNKEKTHRENINQQHKTTVESATGSN